MKDLILYDTNSFDVIDKISLKINLENYCINSLEKILVEYSENNKKDNKLKEFFNQFEEVFIFATSSLFLVNRELVKFINLCNNKINLKAKIILLKQNNEISDIISMWLTKINYAFKFELKISLELSYENWIKDFDELLSVLENRENLTDNISNGINKNIVQTNMFNDDIKNNFEEIPIKNSVMIYTDGACSGNPGAGGWGAVLIHGENKKEISGFDPLTTNNKMEMTAVIKALSMLKQRCRVSLYSDSAYVVNAINLKWLDSWKKNGWKGADKKPVKNIELWQELDNLINYHIVEFIKVKGHSDNELNNRCDELATGEIARNVNNL